MIVTYTGRQVELAPAQKKKVESRFSKLGKLLDGKGEREAHVVVTQERHQFKADVTVRYHDNVLTGKGSDSDVVTALLGALDRIEKQAIKVRAKWRDTGRVPAKNVASVTARANPEVPAAPPAAEQKIYRVNHLGQRKPMTIDEAVLEFDAGRDYLVFRDAHSEALSVLIRRRDGNFDLIEAE